MPRPPSARSSRARLGQTNQFIDVHELGRDADAEVAHFDNGIAVFGEQSHANGAMGSLYFTAFDNTLPMHCSSRTRSARAYNGSPCV